MRVRVTGVDRLTRRFTSTPKNVNSELARTMRRIGADLQGKSQRRAPLLMGDLRGSAYSRLFNTRNGPGVDVGFEGLPYIIVQHEGGWLNYMGTQGPKDIENYTTPGTGSKFLESTWTENLERYKAALREATRKAING